MLPLQITYLFKLVNLSAHIALIRAANHIWQPFLLVSMVLQLVAVPTLIGARVVYELWIRRLLMVNRVESLPRSPLVLEIDLLGRRLMRGIEVFFHVPD